MSTWVGLGEAGGADGVGEVDEVGDAWFEEHRYAELIKDRGVVDEIARHAPRPAMGMGPWPPGDSWLPAQPVPPGLSPAQVLALARRVQPSGRQPRIRTAKRWDDEFDAEIGRTIVAVLCSLARRGFVVCGVEQRSDGCVLVVPLPSHARLFDGTLRVDVSVVTGGSHVDATVEMPGQVVDWGFGRRTLEALAEDIVEWFETQSGVVR
jgi:hypothetical protein